MSSVDQIERLSNLLTKDNAALIVGGANLRKSRKDVLNKLFRRPLVLPLISHMPAQHSNPNTKP
jgi:hypothetical protein